MRIRESAGREYRFYRPVSSRLHCLDSAVGIRESATLSLLTEARTASQTYWIQSRSDVFAIGKMEKQFPGRAATGLCDLLNGRHPMKIAKCLSGCNQLHGFLLCGVVVFLLGCSEEALQFYPVTGVVKFADGSTAQFGSIEFRSETEPPVLGRAKIEKDGTFVARSRTQNGLVAGKHQVIITQIIGSPRDGGTVVHHHGLEVADRYRSYKTSGIQVDVKPGAKNHFELLVESR